MNLPMPVPDVMKESIYELTPRLFTNRGIRLLLLDVDNTLAPYTVDTASERLRGWVRDMRAAGLELYILSNNKGDRPERFAAELGIPFRKRAKKPATAAALDVLREVGVAPEQAALIGDQIYTDTLCAKRCGMFAVTVTPIEFSNIFLRLRWWAEFPFRNAYRKQKNKHK